MMMSNSTTNTMGAGLQPDPVLSSTGPGEELIFCSQINLHHCKSAVQYINDRMDNPDATMPKSNFGNQTNNSYKYTSKIALILEPYCTYGKRL